MISIHKEKLLRFATRLKTIRHFADLSGTSGTNNLFNLLIINNIYDRCCSVIFWIDYKYCTTFLFINRWKSDTNKHILGKLYIFFDGAKLHLYFHPSKRCPKFWNWKLGTLLYIADYVFAMAFQIYPIKQKLKQ